MRDYVMSEEVFEKSTEQKRTCYLALQNVCKQYKTGAITVDALSDVSFDVADG